MDAGCQEIRNKLEAYVDRELTNEERNEVETHLTRCTECTREVNRIKKLGSMFTAENLEEEVPPHLVEYTWRAVEIEAENGKSVFDFLFTRKGLSWSLAFYTIGLIILIAGYLFSPVNVRKDTENIHHRVEIRTTGPAIFQTSDQRQFDTDY